MLARRPTGRRSALALALLLALAPLAATVGTGCGGDPATTPDGGTPDGGGDPDGGGNGECPAPSGTGETMPGQVVSQVAVAQGDVGFDLDGDSVVDNQLAVLALVNEQLALALEEGRLIQLVEVRESDKAENAVEVFLREGEDADGEPCNNLGGQGRFRVVRPAGGKGEPFRAVGTVTNGLLTVLTEDTLIFTDNELTATLRRPRIAARLNADGTLSDGVIGGIVQACDLARIDPQLGTGLNALETLLGLGTLPGVDFDADGLEALEVGEDGKLVRCIDGDGTEIDGADCACDERIADGYSLALTFATVSAQIEVE